MSLIDKTIGNLLEDRANEMPDKEYIVYSDRNLRMTWSKYNERVDAMANGLLSIGVKPGDHVGLWATNVPDWLTIFYASAKIGAVLVTINTNYKRHEVEFLLKDSDIHTLCIIENIFDNNYLDMVREMLPELRETQRGYFSSERFPALKNVVYIGPEKHRGIYSTDELLTLGSMTGRDRLNEVKRTVNCHDVVNIQYTSGTTGFPKGVMLTHHNIVNNGFFTGEGMMFTRDDKLCCCVPLFHCFGLVLATMSCLTHGLTQVMVERFDPLVVLASVSRERCTALYGVPTMFIAEMEHPMFDMFDVTSLRTGIMAGSLCPVELMRRVTEKLHITHITSVYGLTESSPGMTHSVIDDSFELRCTTVGRNYPETEIRVVNPDTGEECAAGEQGELCCRGYLVMKGYYKNPEATAAVIDRDGWLHSGDLGVVDEHGYYRITGRIKDIIIRGGENIYPREIEEYLYRMPQIKDVQVAAIPDEKYGEVPGAFIILKEGQTLEKEDVRDFCRGQIARYKIPKHIFFVDGFPLTGSGKIQKYKLKDIGLKLLNNER
jgi:fatty-acyl-CoA synthase